jgi:hypothetical protein
MENQLEQSELKNTKEENFYIPKILDMKVYFGLSNKDGEKKPDPTKILYYESSDGSCYDCENQQWLAKRPSVCDHLYCREIEASEQDLIAAIAHGVMDDEDYNALDKNGIISEMPKKLWENIKKLKSLNEQLSNNSENLHKAEDENKLQSKENSFSEDSLSDDVSNDVYDDVSNDVYDDYDESDEHSEKDTLDFIDDYVDNNFTETSEERFPGEDVVSQIISKAMAEADDRIREIVREEFFKLLSEVEMDEEDKEEIKEDLEE